MARKINIICVGKVHDALLVDAIALYQKRLQPHFAVEWCIVPPKQEAIIKENVASESNNILRNLENAEYVLLCDKQGLQPSSEAFSGIIYSALGTYKNVYIVIGGAYGVDDRVRARANICVSFGKMVLPRQLMRLVLVEQLYRAASIANGNGYHHA